MVVNKLNESIFEQLSFILDFLPAYACCKSVDGTFLMVNNKLCDALCLSREEILGKNDFDLFPNKLAQKYRADDLKVIATGEPLYVGEEVMVSNGSRVLVATRKAPIKGENGKVIGLIGLGFDITEQKMLEEELRKHHNQLERLVNERTGAMKRINEDLEAVIEELNINQKEISAREAMYRGLFNHMSSGVAVYQAVDNGSDFIIKDFNHAAERIEQVSKNNIVGKSMLEVFPGVMEFGIFEVLQRVWKSGIAEHFPVTLYSDNRIAGWKENYIYKLPTDEIVAIYNDVTEQKKAEKLLQESEEKYRKLFNKANDAIFLIKLANDSTSGRFIEVNEVACHRLGYSREEFLGMTTADITAENYRAYIPTIWRECQTKGIVSFEIVHLAKDGRKIPVEVNSHVFSLNGDKVALSIARDVTERKQAEEDLRQTNEELEATIEELNATEEELRQNYEKFKYSSLHDALTGLYNRTYFEEEMGRLKGRRNDPISIIVCDLDGLKIINDTLGHDSGDDLLYITAGVLREAFREGDLVARIGGDEFAIILPNSSELAAEKACRRIREAIFRYNSNDSKLPLSISIGYATSKSTDKSINDVFKQADNNMYREKLHQNQSARSAIVHTLMETLAARDFITEGHADRMQELVIVLAAALCLNESNISDLKLLARFHDIGKVGIPDRILFKPGPLNQEEYKEMQCHCEIGHRIAQSAPDLAPIADWILKHHEWWNGNGYPLGLKGEEIPLMCRILSITDAYDAMTSNRPYRKAMSHQQAVAELTRNSTIQFDPKLVPLFIKGIEKNNKFINRVR